VQLELDADIPENVQGEQKIGKEIARIIEKKVARGHIFSHVQPFYE
jgi:hypothetical protein